MSEELELQHHGIKGQKWGIRRFQNEDGSLTDEGKKRYGVGGDGKMSEEGQKLYDADRKKDNVGTVLGVVGIWAAAGALGYAVGKVGGIIVDKILEKKKARKTITPEVVSMGKNKTKEVLLLTAGNKLSKPINVKFKGEPSLFGGKRGGVNGSYSYAGPLGKGYNIHTGRMRKMKHSCIELDAFLHSDDDEELQHHGIKGQKWGIRRYQNPDGSLTEEGKKRYNADSYDKMDSANKVKYDEDRRDYNLNNISGTSDILRSIGSATSSAQQIPITSGKTIRKSYPNLTDKELQERINRLSLEQRYSDLKGDTKYERSGGEKVREILQTVGASVAIAGSVAAIAATVYGMRHQIPGSKKGKKKN